MGSRKSGRLNLFARSVGVLLAAAALTAGVAGTRAAVLPVGGLILTPSTTAAADPSLAGTVVADDLRPFEIIDAAGAVIVKGNVQDRVVKSHLTGELIFAPRLRDLSAPSGDAWISQMDVDGYAGFHIDAAYRIDGLGDTAPNMMLRSVGDGNGVRMMYNPNILIPPKSSYFPSLHTNAVAFDAIGQIEIWASSDFGGNAYATVIERTNVPLTTLEFLPGDFNDDRVVDLGDFNNLKRHFGRKGSRKQGDANGDGVVDLDDFSIVKKSFGTRAAHVPEPHAAALAAAALVGTLLLRRRR